MIPGPEKETYKMRLAHLTPENKEAPDDQTGTGANLEGASTGQTWGNVEIKTNDFNEWEQIKYTKQTASEVALALAHHCKIGK